MPELNVTFNLTVNQDSSAAYHQHFKAELNPVCTAASSLINSSLTRHWDTLPDHQSWEYNLYFLHTGNTTSSSHEPLSLQQQKTTIAERGSRCNLTTLHVKQTSVEFRVTWSWEAATCSTPAPGTDPQPPAGRREEAVKVLKPQHTHHCCLHHLAHWLSRQKPGGRSNWIFDSSE